MERIELLTGIGKVCQPHCTVLLILYHNLIRLKQARWCLECWQLLVLGKQQYNYLSRPVLPLSSFNSCVPSRGVPQRQRVSTAMAILMEREWPLHWQPLQLPLISNPQPFPPGTVAVLAKNSTFFYCNDTVFK